jgi:hypothetical protein
MLPVAAQAGCVSEQGRSATAEGGENCKSAGFWARIDDFGSNSCDSAGFFDHFRFTSRLEVQKTVLSQEFERSGYL